MFGQVHSAAIAKIPANAPERPITVNMNFVGRVVAATFTFMVLLTLASRASRGQPASTQPSTTQASTTLPDADREVLKTKHFVITIIDHRDDPYDITSDHVIYIGVSKRTGKRIRLVGSTFHHMDADGTPEAFQGYLFRNGNISYRVYESGDLEIRQGDDKILLSEHGKWDR